MLKPIDDIVYVIAEDGATAGGIILANHKQHVGKVAYVGPGKLYTGQDGKQYRRTPDIQPGDRIVFSWRAGMEQKIEGKSYLVMREGDITAVVDDDAEIGITENRDGWKI